MPFVPAKVNVLLRMPSSSSVPEKISTLQVVFFRLPLTATAATPGPALRQVLWLARLLVLLHTLVHSSFAATPAP
jgi:hypothetical protein